jgi:hypothetical protein
MVQVLFGQRNILDRRGPSAVFEINKLVNPEPAHDS